MPVEHFKSKEAYRKNLAYRHIHGIPFTATEVVIGHGKHKTEHRPEHTMHGERYRIDAAQKHKEAKGRKG